MIQHTFKKSIAAAFGCLAVLSGCMKWDDGNEETAVTSPKEGTTLFIACEGQYQYGNASLSWYDTGSRTVENDVFRRANGQKLGDVAQSMTLENGTLWITVTNSNVVFATDPATCKLKGQIAEGLSQPREIRFISEEKAYVSQMNDPRIAIVNPSRFSVTGYIDTGMDNADGCSTEQMILMGTDLIVNCYSFQKEILIIDTRTDEVTGRIETGVQPCSIRLDKDGKLWVLTDGGGWSGNPAGYEAPALSRANLEKLSIEKRMDFPEGSYVSSLQMNTAGDSLFFLNGGVMAMSIYDETLPEKAVISVEGANFYDMTVCPENSEIYVSDAADYQQAGTVYRFSSKGEQRDRFEVGVCPGAFCWY